VAGDRHAKRMCLAGDGADDGRREHVVHLDLLESQVMVAADHGVSFLGRGGVDLPERVRAAAVDEPGECLRARARVVRRIAEVAVPGRARC
jgi:hypothetical protein